MKTSKRGKPWYIRYRIKTLGGSRVVTIQDGRVLVSYVPASEWSGQ